MDIRHGDRWSGLVLLGFALYIVVEAARLDFGSVTMPGPGFFPILLSIALVALAICVFGSSVAGLTPAKAIHFEKGTYHALFTLGAFSVVAVVFELLGFVICATALMVVLFRWISELSWRVSVLTAISSVLVVYAIFTSLGVPFPKGPLPF